LEQIQRKWEPPEYGSGHRADPYLRFWPIGTFRRMFYSASRRFFAEFPGALVRSRRHIHQSRRKKAEFAATAQPSGHTSPVAAFGQKFETG
jgi:hypothetical protein